MKLRATQVRKNNKTLYHNNLPSLNAIRAQKAKRGLLNFTTYTFYDAENPESKAGYKYNWFHELVCLKLNKFLKDVADGKSPRLMLFAPPRSGKSELASRRFPAYALGKHPNLTFITSSYGKDLAEDMCQNVQEIMETREYRQVFPKTRIKSTISEDIKLKRAPKQRADRFDVLNNEGTRQSVYNACGVNTGTTGKGAHIFVIDDPVKDDKEASSPTYRDAAEAWYKSVALTRVAPGGGILFIMTRWHEDDLAGRLIKQMKEGNGEKWDICTFKAVAEKDEANRKQGDALHPERYNEERLAQIRKGVGSRFWEALYQQNPSMKTGGIFERRWFEIVNVVPRKMKKRVRCWDRAATVKDPKKGNDPDFTAGLKLEEDYNGVLYITDLQHFRAQANKVDAAMLNIAKQDTKRTIIGIPEDPGQAGKDQTIKHKKLLKGYRLSIRRETGDKITRATMASADAEAGNIKILRAPWNETLLSELESFPFAAHDDIVDVLSGAHQRVTGKTFDLRALVNC